ARPRLAAKRSNWSPYLLVTFQCRPARSNQLHQRRLPWLARVLHLDLDLGSLAHSLLAAQDDSLTLRQPVLDNAPFAELLAERHSPVLHLVLGIHHISKFLALVALEGFIGDKHSLVRGADRQPDANEQARLEKALRIV